MAVSFNADDEWYSAETGLPGDIYTTTLWFYVEVDRGEATGLWSLHDATVNHQLRIAPNLEFRHGSTNVAIRQIDVGAWYRAAIVVEGTSGTGYHAKEAAPINIEDLGTLGALGGPGSIFLGRGAIGQYLDGRIAAFKQWDVALTPEQVDIETVQFDPVQTSGLLRYHPFHVAETTDHSGNGNTLSGGVGAVTATDPDLEAFFTRPPRRFRRGRGQGRSNAHRVGARGRY
jgi:hypothetical protein